MCEQAEDMEVLFVLSRRAKLMCCREELSYTAFTKCPEMSSFDILQLNVHV